MTHSKGTHPHFHSHGVEGWHAHFHVHDRPTVRAKLSAFFSNIGFSTEPTSSGKDYHAHSHFVRT